MTASNSQVGGDHYRKYPIQPIEYVVKNGLGFLAGNVVKYVTRYKDKNGAEDIRKAMHYLELILEFEYGEGWKKPSAAPSGSAPRPGDVLSINAADGRTTPWPEGKEGDMLHWGGVKYRMRNGRWYADGLWYAEKS